MTEIPMPARRARPIEPALESMPEGGTTHAPSRGAAIAGTPRPSPPCQVAATGAVHQATTQGESRQRG